MSAPRKDDPVTTIVIELAVGESAAGADLLPVPLGAASTVAAEARRVGVAALCLVDVAEGGSALDPTVAAAYLAGLEDGLGWFVDVPTTHQAPYNVARRVLSLDRATAGLVGVVPRPGQGDEVSDAATPDPEAAAAPDAAAARWREYARVLTGLWQTFPRTALVGDQRNAVVADDTLIHPLGHEGALYRVAGPIDGPSSVQGRPVLVAADVDLLGWSAVAERADVVIVEGAHVATADTELTAALERTGRRREDVSLVARVVVPLAEDVEELAVDLTERVSQHRLDGLVLAPAGGVSGVLSVVRELVPRLIDAAAPAPTLRAALGLREVAEVLA